MKNFKNTFGIDGRTFAAIVRHAEKCGVNLENSVTGQQFTITKGNYSSTVMPLGCGAFIVWNAYTKEKNVEATLTDVKKMMNSLSWE